MTEKKQAEPEAIINPWLKEHRNLTQQAAILKTDPKLAEQLKADALKAEKAAAQNKAAPEQPPTPKGLPVDTRKKKPRPRRCI